MGTLILLFHIETIIPWLILLVVHIIPLEYKYWFLFHFYWNTIIDSCFISIETPLLILVSYYWNTIIDSCFILLKHHYWFLFHTIETLLIDSCSIVNSWILLIPLYQFIHIELYRDCCSFILNFIEHVVDILWWDWNVLNRPKWSGPDSWSYN